MRRRSILAGIVLLLTLQGCAAYRAVERDAGGDLAWPAVDPHVRLQGVIDLHGNLERGAVKLLARLGDKRESFLFQRPYAVAWDGEDLLVADPGAHRIARVNSRGRIRLSQEDVFSQPIGIAACERGIVVTDAATGNVALLDRDLKWIEWLAEGFDRPTGVACEGERVFVVETAKHRVRVRDGDGVWDTVGRRGDGDGEFNYPTSIALDGTTMLVGDTLNFRVQRIDAGSGEQVASLGALGDAPGDMPRIKGVAVDVAAHIWVSDAHLDRVSLYDADGRLLISFGPTGQAAGQFSFPAGIASHPDGRVAVVDSLNRRVQIFRVLR